MASTIQFEEASIDFEFINTIMNGAGGSGDPSVYVKIAMETALKEATGLGADSYSVVNLGTTGTGVSVVIDALNSNGE